MPAPRSLDYAVIRVVPRVEREELVNAGVILYCSTLRFVAGAVELDESRLLALAPDVDATSCTATWPAFRRSVQVDVMPARSARCRRWSASTGSWPCAAPPSRPRPFMQAFAPISRSPRALDEAHGGRATALMPKHRKRASPSHLWTFLPFRAGDAG